MPATVRFALASVAASTATFFLFCLGWARGTLLLAPLLLLLFAIPRQRPAFVPAWTLTVLLPFGGWYLWHALSPEVQPDSLHYHLMMARQTQSTGAFPTQLSFYNLIPQGMETLFALAYHLAGERAAKLLHLAFLFGSIPLLLAIARKLNIPASSAWSAALFYFVTPVVGITATCTYNDAALAFFALSVFLMLLHDKPWAAGALAGFCYAIKLPGAVIPAAGFAWCLWRGNAPRFTLAATAVMAPWLLRNLLLTGNPVAPLFNAAFPNPAFHIESERQLSQWLRDYGGVSWYAIPWEAAVKGGALQGLLGPVWLIIALLLPAARRTPMLLLAGIAAALPWFLNIGTRFLIPALPFFALAVFAALPRKPAAALLTLHAILSLPPIVRLYAAPNAWTLPLQPAQHSDLQDLAAFVEAKTPPQAGILDLAGAPAAITARNLTSAWQTTAGDRMAHALRLATSNDAYLWRTCATVPNASLRTLRLNLPQPLPHALRIHEVELRTATGDLVKPTPLWAFEAQPNPWESPLATDGNPVSAWATWQPVRPGMYWQADFAIAQPIAAVCVYLSQNYPLQIEGLQTPPPERQPALNYRRAAIRYLKREGITHLLTAETADAFGEIAIDIAKRTTDWSLPPALGTVGNAAIYQLP